MGRVNPWIFLLCGLALTAGACAFEPEKQWYKPAASYTVADFRRDEVACTKNRKLDEECLKQRGWTSLSGDVDKTRPKTLEEQERERKNVTPSVRY